MPATVMTEGSKLADSLTPYDVTGTTPYDRLVRAAETVLFDVAPLPNLTVIARAAGIPPDMARQLFPDDTALCLAVMESVMIRLNDHLSRCTTTASPDDPVAQFKALTMGFLDWALENPASVSLLTQRSIVSEMSADLVRRYDGAIHDLAASLLARAEAGGLLAKGANVQTALYHGRALSLGLSRMAVSTNPISRPGDVTVLRCHFEAVLEQFYSTVFPVPDNSSAQPIRSDA